MDCPPGQKKVALVERWPFVEVQLYNWNEHRADWVLILYEVIKEPLKYCANRNTKQRKFLKLLL